MRRPLLLVIVLLAACGARAVGVGPDAGSSEGESGGDGDAGTSTDTSTSTSTGDTTDTADDTDATWTGEGPPPDHPAPGMCDLWAQDCPEGEKCTASAKDGDEFDTNSCQPIMGDHAPGEPCSTDGNKTGLDDCAAGSMCWSVDVDTGIGYCAAFCTGSASDPVCADGTSCYVTDNTVTPVCLAECDPLAPQAQCPATPELCISTPGGDGFHCRPPASSLGDFGDECQFPNECGYGSFCADPAAVPGCLGGQGCCSPYCAVDQPNTCPGANEGQACVPWFIMGQAPPGYENVGGCAIP